MNILKSKTFLWKTNVLSAYLFVCLSTYMAACLCVVSELMSCLKVKVTILYSPSLIVHNYGLCGGKVTFEEVCYVVQKIIILLCHFLWQLQWLCTYALVFVVFFKSMWRPCMLSVCFVKCTMYYVTYIFCSYWLIYFWICLPSWNQQSPESTRSSEKQDHSGET